MINLLWSGGWDSTFRLLYLLLVENSEVTPYYIIDPKRKSLENELNAMKRVRELVSEKHPRSRSLLRNTVQLNRYDIKPNKTISSMYNNLRQRVHVGTQYEWLSSFAEQMKLNDLELCFEKCADVELDRLTHLISTKTVGKEHERRLPDTSIPDDLKLFQYYRFPVIHLSKLEMAELARQHGFLDIMKHTWFCHHPENNTPCGECKPCKITQLNGLPVN